MCSPRRGSPPPRPPRRTRRRGRGARGGCGGGAVVLGEGGAGLVSLLIVVSTFGFLNLSLLSAPRVYYAMAADGLFFRSLARLSPRFRAPTAAILLQGASAALPALTRGDARWR